MQTKTVTNIFSRYIEFRKNLSLAHSILIEKEKQIDKLRAQEKILDKVTREICTKLTVSNFCNFVQTVSHRK
jgi:hypothetical protein